VRWFGEGDCWLPRGILLPLTFRMRGNPETTEGVVAAPRRALRAGKWRMVGVLLLGLVVVVGVAFAIARHADFETVMRTLEQVDRWWIPVCLGFEVAAYAGFVFAFRDTVRVEGGPKLGLWLSARVVLLSFGAFVVATVGGLAVLVLALEQVGCPRRTAVARVLALNTLLYAFFAAFGFAASLALAVGVGGEAPLVGLVCWLVIVPVLVVVGILVSSPARSARLLRVPPGRGLRLVVRRAFATAVEGVVLVRQLVTHPRSCRLGWIGAPLYWLADAACMWAALRAFDVRISLSALLFAYCTGYLAALLPLPAGGVGGVDAAMTFALTLVGVPLAPALLAVFVYRFFKFWLPMLPALALLPRFRQTLAALREHRPNVRPRTAPL
jgi:uncharacterized membrane protein YbhN (UPF0104 family)